MTDSEYHQQHISCRSRNAVLHWTTATLFFVRSKRTYFDRILSFIWPYRQASGYPCLPVHQPWVYLELRFACLLSFIVPGEDYMVEATGDSKAVAATTTSVNSVCFSRSHKNKRGILHHCEHAKGCSADYYVEQ